MSKAALVSPVGLEPLVEYLADDYEMGERMRRRVIGSSCATRWVETRYLLIN